MTGQTKEWRHYITYGSSCDGKTHYIVTDIEVSNLGNIKPGGILFKNSHDGSINIYRGRRCIASNTKTRKGGIALYRLVYELFVGPIPEGFVLGRLKNKRNSDY